MRAGCHVLASPALRDDLRTMPSRDRGDTGRCARNHSRKKAHLCAAACADLEIARPTLMVVDVFMPVIDGIAFCRMVRANTATPDTPSIVMSAAQQDIPIPIAGFLISQIDSDVLLCLVESRIGVPSIDMEGN
jgi:CheY-like chemotaxis protein